MCSLYRWRCSVVSIFLSNRRCSLLVLYRVVLFYPAIVNTGIYTWWVFSTSFFFLFFFFNVCSSCCSASDGVRPVVGINSMEWIQCAHLLRTRTVLFRLVVWLFSFFVSVFSNVFGFFFFLLPMALSNVCVLFLRLWCSFVVLSLFCTWYYAALYCCCR